MRLVLTHYVGGATTTTALDAAVSTALDAAAERIDGRRDTTVIESIDDGVRIHAGLTTLDGSELHLRQLADLTEVRVEVPWSADDAGSPKLWAANRFAGVLAEQLALAA